MKEGHPQNRRTVRTGECHCETSAIQDLEATSPNLVQLEVLFLSARWSCQAVVDFLGESIKAFVFSSIAGRCADSMMIMLHPHALFF